MRAAIPTLLTALLLGACAQSAAAAPPANDNLASATTIASNATTFSGNTTEATRETNEPHNDTVPGSPGDDDHSVWFKWTAPETGLYTFDLCGPGTAKDTTMGVYTGNAFGLGFVARRRNDDRGRCEGSAHTSASAVTFPAEAGTQYKLSVAGASNGTFGPFQGRIHRGPNTDLYSQGDVQHGATGADVFAAALAVGAADASVSCSLDGAAYAPCDDGLRLSGLAPGAHVLRAKASAGGHTDPVAAISVFTVDTTAPDTLITNFADTPPSYEFVYGATEPGASFECRFDGGPAFLCNPPDDYDGLCSGAHSYSIQARDDAFNYDPTPAIQAFTVPAGTACGNPSVETDTPDGISAFSARARGKVTANANVVTAWFEYGTTTAYGATTAPTIVAGNQVDYPVSETMFGRAGEVLHYRLVGRTSAGLFFAGIDRTVALHPAPAGTPTLTTGSPNVNASSVELPYTAKYVGPDDAVVGAVISIGGRVGQSWGDLQRLRGDGADHSGVLRITGLPADTPVTINTAVVSVDGTGRNRLEPPLVVRTLPAPGQPPAPNPPGGGNPQPTPLRIDGLRTGKAKLKSLRRGRWAAHVRCSAACAIKLKLKRGTTLVAKGSAQLPQAGETAIRLKPTRKGKRVLARADRLKAKLTVKATGADGTAATASRRLTFR